MFRTACLVAALALCAATAPPRISLELASTHRSFDAERNLKVGTTHTVDEDYAQECEANKNEHQQTESCLFPEAKAYDAQDQDLTDSVTVAIKLLDNDEVEVNMDVPGSPFKNGEAPKDASAFTNPINNKPASETPSTYLFEYDVKDSAGNEAEKVTFALVLNDVTAPKIVWDQTLRMGAKGNTGAAGADGAEVTIEYGTGLPFEGVANIQCDDNVYNGLTPTVSFSGLPHTTQNALCNEKMNTEHAFQKCAAYSSDFIGFGWNYGHKAKAGNEKRGSMTVQCEDHASIYGQNGQNNVATYTNTFAFADTTAPVIKTESDTETHECDATKGDVQAWDQTVCYDDVLPVKWHHDHSRMQVKHSKTCPLSKINARATNKRAANGESKKTNTAIKSSYDGSCDIEYTCRDMAVNWATPKTRTYYVVDTTPPVMNINYSAGVAGTGNKRREATLDGNALNHLIHPEDDTTILSNCHQIKRLGKECAATMGGTLAHWRCNNGVPGRCTFEDDMENTVVKGALSKIMDVSDTCDSAGDLTFKAKWVVDGGYTMFNARTVGTYKRKYIVSDKSNNKVEADILITLQDPDAPIIQMIGCESSSENGECVDHVEYTYDNEVYKDFGATCHDYVDGSLSHAVEVSGEVVDLKKPKTYLIKYNCQDLSGNAATATTRYVVVTDTHPPVISLNGEAENFVEAGFPYEDAGACYSDQLDGQCCLNQWDQAHDPNEGANDGSNGDHCPNNKKGVSGIWKDAKIVGGGWNKFLNSLKWRNSAGEKRRQEATKAEEGAGDHTSDDRAVGGKGGAELTYVITYDAKDYYGNAAASVYRTIFVRDTLPPVITLHPATGGSLTKKPLKNRSTNPKYTHFINPATYKAGSKPTFDAKKLGKDIDGSPTHAKYDSSKFGNPNLMAETSSVNGWLIAAVASAVAGVALLSFSAKSNQVMVPV
jgi:hypothetical protein